MIEKTSSYKTSDGSVHATIEGAQIGELNLLAGSEPVTNWSRWIVENRDAILAILGKKPRKPRAAKPSAPATKKRAAKTQPELPAA